MTTSFRPHPLLIGGHLQTLATTLLPMPKIPYSAVQHQLTLADGDKLVLHDDCPADWHDGAPMAILLHGLCGCHAASYMIRLADKFCQRGVRCFRLDMRGCGAGRELAAGLPHSGRSDDLLAVTSFMAILAPTSPIWPIGISMGGNIVLKFLGELATGKLKPEFPIERIAQAMAVAPPIDLARCCQNLNRFTLRPYGHYFIHKLRERVPPQVEAREDWKAINWDPKPRTLWDFDDLVTAPLSGFDSVEDYYAQSASNPLVSKIKTPTLVLTSKDDPIVPIGCFHDADWSESVELCIAKRGGHVGFFGSKKLETGDRYWMDLKVLDWFRV